MLTFPADEKQMFKGKGKASPESRDQILRKLLEQPPRPEDLEFKRKRRELNERLARERAMISRIFVGNLAHTVTHNTLVRVFKTCGPVIRIYVSCYTVAPDSTCFAEVVFNKPTASTRALYLNGLLLEGRALVICRTRGETPEAKRYKRKLSRVDRITQGQPQKPIQVVESSNDGSSLAEVSRCLPLAQESTLQSTSKK